MRLLLDTHGLLWALFTPERLPQDVYSLLLDPTNEVLVSIASAWEIGIKRGLGKLTLPAPLGEGVREAGYRFLTVTPEHCEAYAELPFHADHRDPFDRMLVVQSRLEGCRLLSGDEQLDRYDVRRIW